MRRHSPHPGTFGRKSLHNRVYFVMLDKLHDNIDENRRNPNFRVAEKSAESQVFRAGPWFTLVHGPC